MLIFEYLENSSISLISFINNRGLLSCLLLVDIEKINAFYIFFTFYSISIITFILRENGNPVCKYKYI